MVQLQGISWAEEYWVTGREEGVGGYPYVVHKDTGAGSWLDSSWHGKSSWGQGYH